MNILNGIVLVPIILLAISNFGVLAQLLGLSQYRLSEDGRLTFPELAAKYGHPAEEHDVITEDGYILTLYHIPGNKSRAVLMIHGNTPTSDCWIIRGNASLAITMAEKDYDIWAINLRGTRYSRRHVSLNPDTQPNQFFNFTFYEQAIYDVPATIDYVLDQTGQEQLLAITHSVGTTQLLVLGAEKPEYNDKIKLAVFLAPICSLKYLKGLSILSAVFAQLLNGAFSLVNAQEVASRKQVGPLLELSCLQPLGYEVCVKGSIFGSLGYDPDGFEPEFTNTFFGHWPGGSTRKTFVHLGQLKNRDKFAKFDYGAAKNRIEYGSDEPPLFDLSKVTMKSAIFVGRADFLSTVEDVERLKSWLPNVVHYQVMPYEQFNHVDFVWGRNMPSNLYPYLFDVLGKYI